MSSEQSQGLNQFLRRHQPLTTCRQVMDLTIFVALSLRRASTLSTQHTIPGAG